MGWALEVSLCGRGPVLTPGRSAWAVEAGGSRSTQDGENRPTKDELRLFFEPLNQSLILAACIPFQPVLLVHTLGYAYPAENPVFKRLLSSWLFGFGATPGHTKGYTRSILGAPFHWSSR